MQILAASVQQGFDAFLHAGYISASPRRLFDLKNIRHHVVDEPLRLDLTEAFRLKEEAAAGSMNVHDAGLGWMASIMDAGIEFLLFGLLLFFGMLIGYNLLRPRLSLVGRCFYLLAMTGCMGILTMSLVGARPFDRLFQDALLAPLSRKAPPWQDVVPRQYLHPEQATLALMHGVIADAMANCRWRVRNLAQIQDEIGLPLQNRTEGMDYALKTYGWDGWGRPFQLQRRAKDCLLRSAGADGRMDTADDLAVRIFRADDGRWEHCINAFVVQREGREIRLFYHRWRGRLFRDYDLVRARQLTGSTLFDLVLLKPLNPKVRTVRDVSIHASAQSETGSEPSETIADVFDRYLQSFDAKASLILISYHSVEKNHG